MQAKARWEMRQLRKRRAVEPERYWVREVMDRHIDEVIGDLGPPTLDALEVSGSRHGHRAWGTYRALHYPAFDLCAPGTVEPLADVVICEQVLEHLPDPMTAVRTLHDLCRPSGHLIVSTPFMLRIHEEPGDYWRFTISALRLLLETAGFEEIDARSWGNRSSIKANFDDWRPYRRLALARRRPPPPSRCLGHRPATRRAPS